MDLSLGVGTDNTYLGRGRPQTRGRFTIAGRAGKAIADALRWEVRRGRVVKAAKGRFRAGYVAKVTRHRMRTRIASLRYQGQGASRPLPR